MKNWSIQIGNQKWFVVSRLKPVVKREKDCNYRTEKSTPDYIVIDEELEHFDQNPGRWAGGV